MCTQPGINKEGRFRARLPCTDPPRNHSIQKKWSFFYALYSSKCNDAGSSRQKLRRAKKSWEPSSIPLTAALGYQE